MRDYPNEFEQIIGPFAERLSDAPGAARLPRLARSAKRISDALLEHLAALILQLDDVQLVGNDIFVHLIEIGYCDASYADATAFASALAERLQRYLDKPLAADESDGTEIENCYLKDVERQKKKECWFVYDPIRPPLLKR